MLGVLCRGFMPAMYPSRRVAQQLPQSLPAIQKLLPVSISTITTSQPTASSETTLDFSNTQSIYKHWSNVDLIRAYLVFKLCSVKPLVKHADTLLALSSKTLGNTFTSSVVKNTFFKHFCAGEDADSIRPTIEKLHKQGVGAILDYAAEDDVSSEQGPASRADSSSRSVVSRTYSYQSELQCDRHVDIFLRAIQAVSQLPGSNFAAIKVTALGNPALLERVSSAIVSIRDLFRRFDADGSGYIHKDEFLQMYSQLFKGALGEEALNEFKRIDVLKNGQIDYISWCQKVKLRHMPYIAQRIYESGAGDAAGSWQDHLKAQCLTEEEVGLVDAMLDRVEKLAEAAASKGVRLMIDAEHTYFQPAIDHVAMEMMHKYNRSSPLIYTTYQCYLKDSKARLLSDLERATREGVKFGAKLVRGAYLTLERERAAKLGVESPICDTLEETHRNYNECVEVILDEVRHRGAGAMIATHNQRSVELTLEGMGRRGLESGTCGVYFGQLLGMSDHLTFTLGQHGYRSFKYVPYGLVGEVMPYLIRRAQENSDVMTGSQQEISRLQSEMVRRLAEGTWLGRKLTGTHAQTHPAAL